MNRIAVLMAVVLFSAGVCAWADEVEDEINAGLAAYQAGEHTKSIENLEFAVQQIKQLKAGKIGELFPPALEGWSAGKPESMAAGAMFFGGVVSATQRYTRGDSEIEISIATDNPMISFVSGMLSNPGMLAMASQGGSSIKKVKGMKCVVEWDEERKSGGLQTVLENKILISIDADDCLETEMLAYAEAIDYDKIQSVVSE